MTVFYGEDQHPLTVFYIQIWLVKNSIVVVKQACCPERDSTSHHGIAWHSVARLTVGVNLPPMQSSDYMALVSE